MIEGQTYTRVNPYEGYTPNTVTFDGTNDYLLRGDDLTSNADGKLGCVSFWFDLAGLTGSPRIMDTTGGYFTLLFQGGKLRCVGYDSGATKKMEIIAATAYDGTEGLKHALFSWDLANGLGSVWIDDADDTQATPTLVDADIDYTRADWSIGSNVAGNSKLNSTMSDFLFWNDQYLDITNVSNRRMFISPEGTQVDTAIPILQMGTPKVGFTNPLATWHETIGDGGGFTENGALS